MRPHLARAKVTFLLTPPCQVYVFLPSGPRFYSGGFWVLFCVVVGGSWVLFWSCVLFWVLGSILRRRAGVLGSILWPSWRVLGSILRRRGGVSPLRFSVEF